ncbi:MAG: TIGR02530 family flagellar biosynthesis protein [Armatimonadota bacterium]
MVNKLGSTTGVGRSSGVGASPRPSQGGGFASVLARETDRQEGLKISSHAQKRLDSSRVEFSQSDIQRIDGAVRKASEKGSNQSLIMLDDLALVVSVKNRVVVTAVDEARRREGIFTNIDSVVIA